MVDFGVLSGNVSVANFGNKENVVSVATEGITMSRVAADALPVLMGKYGVMGIHLRDVDGTALSNSAEFLDEASLSSIHQVPCHPKSPRRYREPKN